MNNKGEILVNHVVGEEIISSIINPIKDSETPSVPVRKIKCEEGLFFDEFSFKF